MRLRKPTFVVLSTVIALLTGAGAARAGTYTISDCPAASGQNGSAGPWQVFGAQSASKTTCSEGAGDFIGPLAGEMSPNSSSGVIVSVPDGSPLTMTAVSVWWFEPQSTSGAHTYAQVWSGSTLLGEAFDPVDHSYTVDNYTLPPDATNFSLQTFCSSDDYSNGCSIGSGSEAPDLKMFGSQITLSDPTAPAGSATGGALAGSGPISGTESISYSATDGVSGVRFVQLLVDGQVVAEKDYAASCPYDNFLACPASASGSLAWDSTTLANGPHEVAIKVISAAGNGVLADDHAIDVQNAVSGPLPGQSVPNGSPACAAARIVVTVNGHRSPIVVRYGARTTVRGRLLCRKLPVGDATVLISSHHLHASVTTDGRGRFTFHVPRGPTRTLRLTYMAFSNDTAAAGDAHVLLEVQPHIELAIAPRGTFNGGTITWRLRVRSGPYPRHGVTLLVEVREGDRWQPFDEVVAIRGRATYKYTFLRTTAPTDYQFRVALPANGAAGYDYYPGASNAVTVHVS
jgi:hypothetical protein